MKYVNSKFSIAREILLRTIKHNPGITAKELYEHESCPTDNKATVTSIVNIFNSEGLTTCKFERRKVQGYKGVYAYTITEQGQKILDEIDELRELSTQPYISIG